MRRKLRRDFAVLHELSHQNISKITTLFDELTSSLSTIEKQRIKHLLISLADVLNDQLTKPELED